jgi:ABC-2 type transport system ATP-binding protein
MEQDIAVRVTNLRKQYGGVAAVDGVSFDVRSGEIFGLLGPNGAGKTTTLECLEGIRKPDAGGLEVLGIDPHRDPRRLGRVLGVQLQTSGLPEDMTVDESLRFFSAYHGVEPRYDVLDRLGLGEKRRATYRSLSTGQQRRLALALALAHRPQVVVMDEPTAGLDVATRSELHGLMREMKDEGTTILLATHDMAEAEKLADRVAILLRGRIVVLDTPRQLTASGSDLTKITVRTESDADLTAIPLPDVVRSARSDSYNVFFSANAGATVVALIRHIEAKGEKLVDLRVERPTLEERFLELTNEGGAR